MKKDQKFDYECPRLETGCRYNSKNTLDKNYLYLAQASGAKIQAESEVYNVSPVDGQDGASGYRIKWKSSTKLFKGKGEFITHGVVLKSIMDTGDPPTAFIPESRELAEKYACIINGKPMVLLTETLFGIPTTAHILGGAVMGSDIIEGVIDKDNRVFDYENMYVCDGSMISANISVNPSLTITALSERAMRKVPPKS